MHRLSISTVYRTERHASSGTRCSSTYPQVSQWHQTTPGFLADVKNWSDKIRGTLEKSVAWPPPDSRIIGRPVNDDMGMSSHVTRCRNIITENAGKTWREPAAFLVISSRRRDVTYRCVDEISFAVYKVANLQNSPVTAPCLLAEVPEGPCPKIIHFFRECFFLKKKKHNIPELTTRAKKTAPESP